MYTYAPSSPLFFFLLLLSLLQLHLFGLKTTFLLAIMSCEHTRKSDGGANLREVASPPELA
jgi:hypothetical protein